MNQAGLSGHLYDWENDLALDRQNDDIAFYLQQLKEQPPNARVLELGCGTGRISLPLARAGYPVIGVDLDADRLYVAQQHTRPTDPVTWLEADMCTVQNDQPFDLILITYSSFLLLPTHAARRQCLNNLARQLTPSGRLIIDISPNFPRHQPCRNKMSLRGFCKTLNADVTNWIDIEQNTQASMTHFTRRYHIEPRERPPYHVTFNEHWWWCTPGDMGNLLQQTPLTLDTLYGDYAANPLQSREQAAYKHIYSLCR